MQYSARALIGGGCFFNSIISTEKASFPIFFYRCSETTILKRDALWILACGDTISIVLSSVAYSQIFDKVVTWISIFVVNPFRAITRPVTVMPEPYHMMDKNTDTVYPYLSA